MKRILLTLSILIFTCSAFAQAPNEFNYQGVARNNAGNPLVSQAIGLRLTIHTASSSGTVVYQETQTATTNSFGLYVVAIGTGTVVSGTFSTIAWGTGTKWLQVEMDPSGGTTYTTLGTSQLLSVPYALSTANGVTSTGSFGYLPKYNTPTTLNNSVIYQNGTNLGINITTPFGSFDNNSSDSVADFTSTTYSGAINYGINRTEYHGTNDITRYGYVASTIRTLADTNGIGVEGAGGKLGILGYAATSTPISSTSSVRGLEGDAFNDFQPFGIAGFAETYSGVATGSNINIGVFGSTDGLATTNYAGYFNGDAFVVGTLYKLAGSFKIDHPLDPDNKYLVHSFVESPDMMNIYNGNVTTDATGTATVTLPSYFEALNQDFRYQLTCIGTFAQAIVSQEVSGNQFQVKTSVPNVKVSWQVTGIRHDAYANAHRIQTEVPKEPNNVGKYLTPVELGKSPDLKINNFKPSTDRNSANVLPAGK